MFEVNRRWTLQFGFFFVFFGFNLFCFRFMRARGLHEKICFVIFRFDFDKIFAIISINKVECFQILKNHFV